MSLGREGPPMTFFTPGCKPLNRQTNTHCRNRTIQFQTDQLVKHKRRKGLPVNHCLFMITYWQKDDEDRQCLQGRELEGDLQTWIKLKCSADAMSVSQLQRGGGDSCGCGEWEVGLATLEKQLMCPICLEILHKPIVILPCQHNLCRRCANELYQAQITMTEGSGNFRCPSCHHRVVMDRHGVFSLQRNLLVESIIDIYKRKVCNNDDRPLPLPPSLPAQVTCSQHSDEKVSIYCITCQLATCSLCKVFGEHQSCQVQPLTDALQQKREELREGVASMVQINQKVRALMDELEEKRRKIEETCKTHKQNVCDKFRRMFSILDERLVSMSDRISKDEVEKSGSGQLFTRCYGDKVEANRKLIKKAVSAMEDPDMAVFVQNSKELIAKVKAAASFSLAETVRPSADKLRRFRCNFSQQEWAIAAIDFITLEDCTKPTQNTETTAPPSQTEDEPTEAPLWHSAPPLGLSESSIQDVDREEEQLPIKEEAGEAKELSDSQGEMTAQIDTQQAVIVLFYLVAFLVLLQKAWSCVGCFTYT